MSESTKILALLIAFFLVAPAGALLISWKRWMQHAAFGLLIFMTVMTLSDVSLNLHSIEWYRGHTKGFEFAFIEVIALMLILSSCMTKWKDTRLFPPGTLFYGLFLLLSAMSYFSAIDPLMVQMSILKWSKLWLVYVAAYNYLERKEDLIFVALAISFTFMVHGLVCVKARYIDGVYQVRGWFDHQNSAGMYTYFAAFPIFAIALAKGVSKKSFLIILVGVVSAALIIILGLSRGAMGVFALGLAGILAASFLWGPSFRRIGMAVGGVLATGLVLLVAMDSIMGRINMADDNDRGGDYREILIEQAQLIFESNPNGVGWNNYALINSRPFARYSRVLEYWESNRRGGANLPDSFFLANPLPESLYWCIIAETGYWGLAGWFLFIGVTLFWAIRNIIPNRDTYVGLFLIGVCASLSLTYLHSNLERILTQTNNYAMWLVMLGFVAKIESWRRENPEKDPLGHFFRQARAYMTWVASDWLKGEPVAEGGHGSD